MRTYSIGLAIFLAIASFLLFFRYIDNYFPAPDAGTLNIDFNDADKFIKYGYPEIKALSIQFLTLITAILVFSITFSEKIINYSQASRSIRFTLVSGWTLLILAIVSDGIGIAYNALALPYALADLHEIEHYKRVSAYFYGSAFTAIKAVLMSGVFFVSGLICIVISGIVSLFKQSVV